MGGSKVKPQVEIRCKPFTRFALDLARWIWRSARQFSVDCFKELESRYYRWTQLQSWTSDYQTNCTQAENSDPLRNPNNSGTQDQMAEAQSFRNHESNPIVPDLGETNFDMGLEDLNWLWDIGFPSFLPIDVISHVPTSSNFWLPIQMSQFWIFQIFRTLDSHSLRPISLDVFDNWNLFEERISFHLKPL